MESYLKQHSNRSNIVSSIPELKVKNCSQSFRSVYCAHILPISYRFLRRNNWNWVKKASGWAGVLSKLGKEIYLGEGVFKCYRVGALVRWQVSFTKSDVSQVQVWDKLLKKQENKKRSKVDQWPLPNPNPAKMVVLCTKIFFFFFFLNDFKGMSKEENIHVSDHSWAWSISRMESYD